jgi:WD40 repeat protein
MRHPRRTTVTAKSAAVRPFTGGHGLEWTQSFRGMPDAYDIAWSADGAFIAASGTDGEVVVWSAADRRSRFLRGHEKQRAVRSLAWHPNNLLLATSADDMTVRFWDVMATTSEVFCTLDSRPKGIAWSPDGSQLAIGAEDGRIGIWDARDGALRQYSHVQNGPVYKICWPRTGNVLITSGRARGIRILTAGDLTVIRALSGHYDRVRDIDLSPDGSLIVSASDDRTVRIWELATGAEIATLEGHTSQVFAARFSPGGDFIASAADESGDGSDAVLLWRCRDWTRVGSLPRREFTGAGGLAFHPSEPLLAVKELSPRQIDCYSVDYSLLSGVAATPGSRRYVNAKVVLLGDTGVGKSGLGLVLSGQPYAPTDSTHGRKVWTVASEDVQIPGEGQQTREVLLWDLAGQPGYRLIHQLHLQEVAVSLVVFDSRSETDPFSGVKYWARALAQARKLEGGAAVPIKAYLVAARADRGGVAVSADRIRAMVGHLGLDAFFETSAKEGWHVADLSQAIREGIDWDALPMISSSALFESIKRFLLEEK